MRFAVVFISSHLCTPEGHLLFDFGIEGQSSVMQDGYPAYTDLILRNPEKLAPFQRSTLYTRASCFGPFVQDMRARHRPDIAVEEEALARYNGQ